ncbi:MAG: class I tRNA ligase family protein, partial [Clostridia bacterium]|nr:class I tRNA ligase family protein [Clostridia bacterium]
MNNFVRPRPKFPKKAVITGGMPNGGKHLTFAHVGLMLRTDTFARFMRDRIGAENVIFVSGTDCYGSPPMEKYRRLRETNAIDKNVSLAEFSESFYREHEQVFRNADVSFNLYGASAFGDTKAMHEKVSQEFLDRLIEVGMVEKQSSYAFYDKKLGVVLNGRQVEGKCPIPNCQGEHGYAETCDLGHQYLPQDLIDPISTLSNT